MVQPIVSIHRVFAPLLAVAGAAIAMTGCATQPGLITGTSPSGYILSAAEMGWHCGGLENAVNARIATIVTLTQQAKANAKGVAPTVSVLVARVMGQPVEDEVQAQIKTERAAADAYNASLSLKGCPKVDIDGKLAAAGVGRAV